MHDYNMIFLFLTVLNIIIHQVYHTKTVEIWNNNLRSQIETIYISNLLGY